MTKLKTLLGVGLFTRTRTGASSFLHCLFLSCFSNYFSCIFLSLFCSLYITWFLFFLTPSLSPLSSAHFHFSPHLLRSLSSQSAAIKRAGGIKATLPPTAASGDIDAGTADAYRSIVCIIVLRNNSNSNQGNDGIILLRGRHTCHPGDQWEEFGDDLIFQICKLKGLSLDVGEIGSIETRRRKKKREKQGLD